MLIWGSFFLFVTFTFCNKLDNILLSLQLFWLLDLSLCTNLSRKVVVSLHPKQVLIIYFFYTNLKFICHINVLQSLFWLQYWKLKITKKHQYSKILQLTNVFSFLFLFSVLEIKIKKISTQRVTSRLYKSPKCNNLNITSFKVWVFEMWHNRVLLKCLWNITILQKFVTQSIHKNDPKFST